FKKKRLALLLGLLLLGGVAWRVDLLSALVCLAGAVLLLLLLRLKHIVTNHFGMKKLKTCRGYTFQLLQQALSEPPRPRPWRFIVLGDTRNNTTVAAALYRQARTLDPVMAFHTGDIIRGGKASELLGNHVRLLEEHLNPIPLFCVPGNHERGPRRDYGAFKTLYGDDKFAFAHDECLFVGFNNCAAKGVTERDLEFLEQQLARQYEYKFVFTHIPPAFFEATFAGDTRRRGFKRGADAFHALLRRHQVNEVFMAHIHGYATKVLDGVRYTLTAGGGAPLSGRIAAENRHFHLIEMEVGAHGLKRRLMILDRGQWIERTVDEKKRQI
ncbi:MAG TPA: metallophosphoesterase, partial [Candidatus Hydrogenedentes bacterium]|nr:metallophosphoesterase [Candidatus Hydrogenedentota bacterium]